MTPFSSAGAIIALNQLAQTSQHSTAAALGTIIGFFIGSVIVIFLILCGLPK